MALQHTHTHTVYIITTTTRFVSLRQVISKHAIRINSQTVNSIHWCPLYTVTSSIIQLALFIKVIEHVDDAICTVAAGAAN